MFVMARFIALRRVRIWIICEFGPPPPLVFVCFLLPFFFGRDVAFLRSGERGVRVLVCYGRDDLANRCHGGF